MNTADADWEAERSIASHLRLTWDPFFSRFGRLTAVQREVIPAILSGGDVLVCSPTASGKTEAVCAPLLERLGASPGLWTVLYVSPTRALVNDLYHRLIGPVAALRHRLVRRTGEYKDALTEPPRLLLTTPESFDSLLCRGRRDDGRHVLAHVRAVVLDEIHLLHGTARGAQLTWLLKRLRRLRHFARNEGWVTDDDLQVVALSATVANPTDVADAYLPGAEIALVPGQRAIDDDTQGGDGPTEETLLRRLGTPPAPSKVLVFCNTRKRVDQLSGQLRAALEGLGYAVQAHHGSLSQSVREEAEEEVRLSERIVLFCTSTLEIGIDIGDIDLVVLDAPPPDVSSLLQRVGRGNRRADRTVVMCSSKSPMDRLLHRAMLDAARAGDLGSGRFGPQYAVARQQLASFVFQAPKSWRPNDFLARFLAEGEPDMDGAAFVSHLTQAGELVVDGDRVRLGDHWLEVAASGAIHSNIEATPGNLVVDAVTGKVLAHGVTSKEGSVIGVGGKAHVVKEQKKGKLEVQALPDGNPSAGEWRYVTGGRFVGASQPQAVRRMLGIPADVWPVMLMECYMFAFHLGGGEMSGVLSLLLPDRSSALVTPWYIGLPGGFVTKPAWIAEPDSLLAESNLLGRLDSLERELARPVANRRLPTAVRIAEVRSWLSLSEQLGAVKNARWTLADQRLSAVLAELL